MLARLTIVALFLLLPAAAQLTPDQRLADFHNLADFYARRYAAIDWKKSVVKFDLLDLTPWLPRVAAAKNDLEFYDLMVEYVSNLQDAHDQYVLPSDFEAWLDITCDIYDGKVLIDSIDRRALPTRAFAPQIGDEILKVDGKPVADLIAQFSKYVSGGNPRTVQRLAAEMLADRYQGYYPWAHEVGEFAAMEIRSGDMVATYSLPWHKSGSPVTTLGPSAPPYANAASRHAAAPHGTLERFHTFKLPGRINVLGFGRLAPVFAMPSNFVQTMGAKSSDTFYAGTYTADDGTRLGYLRIPSFEYLYLKDLDTQIANFNANTDALVVDVMRNPGGDVCLAEDILSRLTTREFFGSWAEVRVTWSDILELNYALSDPSGYTTDELAQLQNMQAEYQEAYQAKQGRTKPLPICAAGATRFPNAKAYTKPLLVLADEMSASSADIFSAMVQDNQIAPIFGYRTMGAGGSPEADRPGVYSEGYTTLTRSLVFRAYPVVTPDFPTTSYVENVGVRPEIAADYMTADNLVNRGAAFVKALTAEAVRLTKKQ